MSVCARIIFFAVFLAAGCGASADRNRVCLEAACYDVEVAGTYGERTRGLQGRERLADEAGMLFVFVNSAPHGFWMKDTLIPLDMIWLDHARRVVHIETDVPPCRTPKCPSYVPSAPALYVLELNAGEVAQKGIALGQEAKFELDAYLSRASVSQNSNHQ